jgi:hypothetical protein
MTTHRKAKTPHLPAVLAALALSLMLGACSREDDAVPGADNALLDYVPADTPYLAASLERPPEAVVDAYLQRIQPVLDEVQAQLAATRAGLESDAAAGGQAFEARVMLAVLRELDGKLSREGLNSLGIDVLAHKVTYGAGAFPVFRTGLSDPAALRATVQRVLDDLQLKAPEQEFQGVSFWRIWPDIHGSDVPEVPVGLYIAILDDHLAIGILPPAAEADLLPGFLGLERPAQSDARARLAELNRTHGYTNFGSAIVDLRRMADEFLQPGTLTAGVMAKLGAYDPATLTPECVAEVYAFLDNVPQMTAGTTELSENAVAYQYRLETPPTLAGELMSLVARIPAADLGSQRMLDLAFGMRFGGVRDFLRQKLEGIVQNPYRCERFQELNARAAEVLAKLQQPMPPFVNNFRGIRVSLDEVLVGQGGLPSGARGVLALHVDQPEMFIGMAQMFLPNLAQLGLKAGSPPVRLPDDLFPIPGMVGFAAMTDEAIGLSVGEGEEKALEDYLERKAGPEGMFLSVSYDTAAYLEYSQRMVGDLEIDTAYRDRGDGHSDAGSGRAHEGILAVAEAAQKAIRESADRSATTLSFDAGGLVIDGRMTFKPLP